MRYLLMLVLLSGCSDVSMAATEKEHKIMNTVPTVEDIPYNECRFVMYPPRSLIHLEVPQSKLMCNTFGVVRNADLMPQ